MRRAHLPIAAATALLIAAGAQAQSPSATAPPSALGSAPLAMSAAPMASASASPEDTAANAFVSRCSGCHTVGGGNLQGPDLLPATQWSDTQLRPAIKLMEKRVGPLSNDELDSFSSLLRDPTVRDRITTAQRASMQKMEATTERPSPAVGADLFRGVRALANGGLPCSTCHQAAGEGGNLGPELTNIAAKISGPALVSAVRNASFNVMRAAYREHPITPAEAMHLAAWFETLKDAPAGPKESRVSWLGVLLGGLVFCGLILTLRPREGVRARLLRRALRK